MFFENIFMYWTHCEEFNSLQQVDAFFFSNLKENLTWQFDVIFSFLKTWTSFKGNKVALKILFPRNWAMWGSWNHVFFFYFCGNVGMGVCNRGGPHLVDESYQLYMHKNVLTWVLNPMGSCGVYVVGLKMLILSSTKSYLCDD